MAVPLLIAGAAVGMIGGAIGSSQAGRRASRAGAMAGGLGDQISALEANRAPIVNPYENIEDLSSMIQNPYAHLQVATGAAEMQAQQADLSLASMQETLQATGAGAGGATALAQAALRSKQGVAATIEQQEVQNARLRAQGEAAMNQQLMQEQIRLQQADASGKAFMFQARDQREMQQLNRMSALQSQYLQQQAGHQSAQMASQQQMFGALSGMFTGMASAGGASTGNVTNNYIHHSG